jgi:hypothetical protein
MATPYPVDFPTGAFMLVLDKVRGRTVSPSELVHGAWEVAGYALSQTMGGGPLVSGDTPAAWSDEQVIEAAIAQADPKAPAQFGFAPMVLVLKIALKILLSLV